MEHVTHCGFRRVRLRLGLAVRALVLVVALGLSTFLPAADTFRVASYNLENYLLADTEGRVKKSLESRSKVWEIIERLDADVLALQEVGGGQALDDLRSNLQARGLRYDHAELVHGPDPHICVAVLSRIPILARRPHRRESFLLLGRRHLVSRGILEIDLQPAPDYRFTLFNSHLKSRREVPQADEEDLRAEEARILREKVDARLTADPKANIVVLGDFNDTKDSRTIRSIVGKGAGVLIDIRPAEQGSSRPANPAAAIVEPRSVTWTHYYAKEDSYSRVDYLLITRGLYHEWVREDSWVYAGTDWGIASDHRPVVATFRTQDRGFSPSPRSSKRR